MAAPSKLVALEHINGIVDEVRDLTDAAIAQRLYYAPNRVEGERRGLEFALQRLENEVVYMAVLATVARERGIERPKREPR